MNINDSKPIDFIVNNLDTSPPSENIYYGLDNELLVNNNQGLIQYEEILFIDSPVEDYQSLIDNLAQPTEVVILDPQRDGIVQIADSLSQYDSWDAVHIVSHGDVGQLFLGNAELNQNTLPQYADILTSWGDFIEEDGDILLYGCDVAADLSGAEFVKDLSEYTNADIQASNDLTGSSKLDGDWDLEYATGEIETELIFNTEIQDSYEDILVGSDFSFNANLNNFIDSNFPSDFNMFGSRTDINIDPPPLDIDTYDFNDPLINADLLNFTPSLINFDSVNFDFGIINADSNSITFGFESMNFDFSSLTGSRDSIEFAFDDYNFNFDSILSFDADSVLFENSTVKFEYNPDSVNFSPDLFAANANLYDYKLSFSNFEEGVTFNQFNASDYRALDYAFNGDELFNTEYYLAQGVTSLGMNPFSDYVENGYQAGFDPNSLFDVSYYLDQNIDVRQAAIDPLRHYAEFGFAENRDPIALFDTSYYNENNPDIVEHGINPLLHYILFGYSEDFNTRDPNQFFDSSYYNASNPDVVAEGVNPLQHYIQFGWRESRANNPGGTNPNRNPNPLFDTDFYFETHEDVRLASFTLDSANPLQHYLEFGQFSTENRITHPIFESPNQVAFTTVIDSESEGFEFVQNNLNQYGVEAFPGDNGEIIIAQSITDEGGGGFDIIGAVGAIVYSIYSFGEYVFTSEIETETGSISVFEYAAQSEGSQIFSTVSFTLDDLFTNPPGFPIDSPRLPIIESFPIGEKPEDIIGTDGKFWTPLEPIDDLSENVESFPLRDEILEGLLNGPFVFPSEGEIPVGVYTIDNSSSSSDRSVYDLGFARELKVAEIVGGVKASDPSDPSGRRDAKVTSPGLRSLRVDVFGANDELILVGGKAKQRDIEQGLLKGSFTDLKRLADAKGVDALAYFADNTTQETIDIAIEVLGEENVFTFTDATYEDSIRLNQEFQNFRR